MDDNALDIFLVAPPGLEAALADEASQQGFAGVAATEGGVTLTGSWLDVWRANLVLRGAIRVLVRIAEFRALHLAQLDKRARKVDWGTVLRADRPVRVEAACRRSRIYHAGAAAQRVATAIAETLGAPIADDAALRVMVRIVDDLVTISIDSSGEPLHKRGYKQAVNAAPMRESMAALFLRQAGFDGAMPVLDPMCGSGTFVIEAAEMAAGLLPGRGRRFAFEEFVGFDAERWQAIRAVPVAAQGGEPRFFGSDRDPGAITMSRDSAERAGVAALTRFEQVAVSERMAPEGGPGLVIVNPPYGGRLSKGRPLAPLYAALGRTLRERFSGWRVGLITSDPKLAHATALPFKTPFPSVDNGGLRVKLHVAGPLG